MEEDFDRVHTLFWSYWQWVPLCPYWHIGFSEIGDGWAPAVLETEEEFHFLQEALIFFASTYWYGFYIGGSTCIAADQTTYPPIDDSEYFDDDSGNIIFEWFIT